MTATKADLDAQADLVFSDFNALSDAISAPTPSMTQIIAKKNNLGGSLAKMWDQGNSYCGSQVGTMPPGGIGCTRR